LASFRRTEKMHVIGHDDVRTNCPLMSLTCLAQFVYQNLSYDISHQDRAASKRTDRDEIDWKLNAYAIETLQMFVHANPLVEVIGLGQLGDFAAKSRGRRPRLQPEAKLGD